MSVNQIRFNDFTVYSVDDCNSFVYIDISDSESFYKNLFNYFFDETRLLRYIENKTSVSFSPTAVNYAALFKKLKIFLDSENDIKLPENLENDILGILCEEHTIIEDNGTKKIRLDKMGKMGEYIFSNLLSEYFGYQCVIPKLNMITDYNMSVFGIDTLFYSPENKLLLLGESKVSKTLKNGIALINKSLSEYQSQIDDEFELILSQRWLKDKMGYFVEDFGDKLEISLSMGDFIKKANIQQIGVPIFIAHGGTDTPEEILDSLIKKINRTKLYNLETKYIIVSLPLIDKEKCIQTFTNEIIRRRDIYESNI